MLLPFSFLQLAELILPFSLCVRHVFAQRTAFNFKAHGTGYQRVGGGDLSENVGVSTSDDLSYTVEVSLGGENFVVLFDTGSSDFWVNTTGRSLELTNSTDLVTGIGYGKGQVVGTIDFAKLEIGDFVIPSQAFLNPTEITDFGGDIDGIIGMAFDNGPIYAAIQRAWGTEVADELALSPMTSLFDQNPDLPNNFDVQLARTSELEDIAEGTFLISGHDDGFEAVAKAPKLPRVNSAHWDLVMDGMNINGKAITLPKSRIPGTPAGKVVAMLDTGFSFPPIHEEAVNAIYGSIPGAVFDPVAQLWMVPCHASTNLTFVFGGEEFPVHPLDLTFPLVTTIEVDGMLTNLTACINTYQPMTLDPSRFAGFDIILGDAFLRNVYASFDYGDFYPGTRTNGLPFVQMISTTNTSTMWAEFHAEREAMLAELPPAIDPAVIVKAEEERAAKSKNKNLVVSGASADDDDDSSTGGGLGGWSKKYGVIVIGLLAANLVVVLTLLVVTLTMCVRGVKGRSVGARYTPVRFKDANGDDYERGAIKYSD